MIRKQRNLLDAKMIMLNVKVALAVEVHGATFCRY
jgi:hypothetical protein